MDSKIDELYNSKKVDEAIHALIEKIDKDPHNTDNYLQLSTYLIDQGAGDQAMQLLEKAKGLVKDSNALDYNLAVAYYTQGEFDKALNLLNNIPNDDLTLYQKALVYLKLGQNEKALAFALSIKNVDDRVKELLGDIWLAWGDLKSAKQSYDSIPEDNRTAKIYFLLGVSTYSENRDLAEKYFAKSKSLDEKYYNNAKDQYGSLMKLISQNKNKTQN